MVELDLSLNNITGTLPSSWDNLTQASTSSLFAYLHLVSQFITLSCSPVYVLKGGYDSIAFNVVTVLGLSNNLLMGTLPETCNNLHI